MHSVPSPAQPFAASDGGCLGASADEGGGPSALNSMPSMTRPTTKHAHGSGLHSSISSDAASLWLVLLAICSCTLPVVQGVAIHQRDLSVLQGLQAAWGIAFDGLYGNECSVDYGPLCNRYQCLRCNAEGRLIDMGLELPLSGSIPASISALENLQYLTLYNTRISGSIPSSIGSLKNLRLLNLAGNQLSSETPESIGALTNLTLLWLSDNPFSGKLPATLANVQSLVSLKVPSWVQCPASDAPCLGLPPPEKWGAFCKEMCVEFCNRCNAALSLPPGSAIHPSDLKVLQTLQTTWGIAFDGLYSSDCSPHYGPLCNRHQCLRCDAGGRLIDLGLEQALSGSIPASISALENLQYLTLYNTRISGSIPSSIGALKNLRLLNLAGNQLSSEIPESIGALTNLTLLWLSDNPLSGKLPATLANVQSLVSLKVPSWVQCPASDAPCLGLPPPEKWGALCKEMCVEFCNRCNAALSLPPGSAIHPSDLKVLQTLQATWGIAFDGLYSSDCSPHYGPLCNRHQCLRCDTGGRLIDLGLEQPLSGSIPASISALENLQYLSLFNTQLFGSIPASIGALKRIQVLNLAGNQLSSELPESIGALTNLTFLWLSENPLSGKLPASLANVQSLVSMMVPSWVQCPANDVACPDLPPPEEWSIFCKETCVEFCNNCNKVRPRPPPPHRSPPPTLVPKRSPPPKASPPPPSGTVVEKPPPPVKSPPVLPVKGLSFGFAPALSFTPRFLNGQVFRHASVSYNYNRSIWKIDSSIDWTTRNNALEQAIKLPIKEQGPCAACWAMAPVSAVSAAATIVFNTLTTGLVPDLSVQQVISCSSSQGCVGGLPSAAFNYIANLSSAGQKPGSALKGLFTENNYPFTTMNSTCKLPTCPTCVPTQYGITMYEQADFYGWFGLLLTLQQQPAVVTLFAACPAFQSYTNGILDSSKAAGCYSVPNHAVLAVGYALDAGLAYWVLQNSWGANWGERGLVRIAITGGFGLFNMHLMPALYPVITTVSPCDDPINPCGSGTCVPNGDGSNRCECRDPFVSVTNIDNRTQSCVPKTVCTFFLFNPCSVGTCVDDGKGGYSCVCPLGFVDGERSTDGSKTCVPSSAIGPQKYTVSVAGLTCSVIAASFSLTVDQLLQQNINPPLVCDESGVAIGTVVNVTQDTLVPCNVVYTWNQGDNCLTVAQHLALSGGWNDLETLNPWLKCSESPPTPGMQVCVRRGGAPTSLPSCTNYYTAQKGDRCETILAKFKLNTFEFYALNPGINCDRLQFADMGVASGQQVCISADTVSIRLCPEGSMPRRVVRGDTCSNLLARFFTSLEQMAAFNYRFQCTNHQLLVGQIICTPASSGGGRPPPPVKKRSP